MRDMLIDLIARGVKDLLGHVQEAESGVAALHFRDYCNKFSGQALGLCGIGHRRKAVACIFGQPSPCGICTAYPTHTDFVIAGAGKSSRIGNMGLWDYNKLLHHSTVAPQQI